MIGMSSCSGMLHGVEPATRCTLAADVINWMVSQIRSRKPFVVLGRNGSTDYEIYNS